MGTIGEASNQEKSEAKKFRNKGMPFAIEELCDRLYGDVVADGSECVTPSINPNVVQSENIEGGQVGDEEYEINNGERVGGSEGIEDEVFAKYNHYASRLESLERSGGNIWCDLTDEMRNDNIEELNQGLGDTQVQSSGIRTAKELKKNATKTTKHMPMKRKKRRSMGSMMMSRYLESMVEICGRATQALESDCHTVSVNSTQTPVNNAVTGMNVLNHMDGLEKGTHLWCYAVDLLEDARRTDLFLNMEDDATRLSWLKYKYDRQDS